MYGELAHWWPLISPPADYAEEAAFFRETLLEACKPPARTLLELGSGGGNNASFLKQRFELVLVELSPGMLEVSRALNPECLHVQGDMRNVRLGREFDCVFVHDAIDYMTSLTDLRRAFETAFVHLRPGGVALFMPDHLREHFEPSSDSGGSDGPDRAVRFLEWTWDPDPSDSTITTDYLYALRGADGQVHVEHDRHVTGLFARADWLCLLEEVGFESRAFPFTHSEVEPGSMEGFVATRPKR